jgi:hypothetical protein
MGKNRDNAVQAIRRAARPLRDLSDLDSLIELIGESRIVLLGSRWRARRGCGPAVPPATAP